MALALEMLISGVYQLPMMAGYGKHWPLAPEESRVLAAQAEACITSLPAKQIDRSIKFVAQVAPWIGLVTSVFVVTYARVQETRNPRGYTGPHLDPQPVPGGGGPADNGSRAPDGAASGVVSPRLSNLFGEGV